MFIWVNEKDPAKTSNLEGAPGLRTVIQEVIAKSHPDDFIVDHDTRFDMEQCLRRTATNNQINNRKLDFILDLLRFCAASCEYVKSTLHLWERCLLNLCAHSHVELVEASAQDTTSDNQKLAE